METAFFLAIISVCPFSLGNCYSEEDWTRYISEPFQLEETASQSTDHFNITCKKELDKLRVQVRVEGSLSFLCVNEEIWRKHRPEYE
jgi:hypothetical protein